MNLKQVCIILIIIGFSGLAGCHHRNIPSNTTEYQSKQYLFILASLSWHEAAADCKEKVGMLAAIKSQADNDFMVKFLDGKTVWLGATDEATEGV